MRGFFYNFNVWISDSAKIRVAPVERERIWKEARLAGPQVFVPVFTGPYFLRACLYLRVLTSLSSLFVCLCSLLGATSVTIFELLTELSFLGVAYLRCSFIRTIRKVI